MNEWIFVGSFATQVIEYIRLEWEVELSNFPQKYHDRAFGIISDLNGKQNVPNIAGMIATEVLTPL